MGNSEIEVTMAKGSEIYVDDVTDGYDAATGKTAKYIRVFVWNGANTMKPYQAAEEIVIE